MSSLLASVSRISNACSVVPRICRSIYARGASRDVPLPRGANQPADPKLKTRRKETVLTPTDFLKAIGRSSEKKLNMPAVEEWESFWKLAGPELKKAGLAVRDRKYIMWCMSKYREGYAIDQFAHEPLPKRTIRGRGPRVQNGKLLRSRRIKH